MKTLDDLTAPAPVTKKLLEADVQSACVDWMRARGYWARKFSSMTQRSVPDYLFAKDQTPTHREIKFACEFKAPGKKPTDAQLDEMEAMDKAGWYVVWHDDIDEFKKYVLLVEDQHRKFG